MPRRTRVPKASSELIRQRMMSQKRRDTGPELEIRSRLHRLGHRFRVDYRVPGTRRRIDIAFTRKRIAVFIDGCFWHSCPRHATQPKSNRAWWKRKLADNVRRDRATDRALRRQGWVVVRVWEHESGDAAVRRIDESIRHGSARASGGSRLDRTMVTLQTKASSRRSRAPSRCMHHA